jgi:hypothetical protein
MLARTLLAVAGLLVVPSLAVAQNPQTRSGFGISFGIGGGSGAAGCDGCTGDRETGPSGYLRLGGYVRPHVFIAFESNGYVKTMDGVDITGGFYQAVAQWYPNPVTGFYLKGGAGLMSYLETDGVDELTVSALGIGVGIGYDARVGTNFSLTPYANLLLSGKGDAKLNGFSSGFDVSFNLLQIGLGFTWH